MADDPYPCSQYVLRDELLIRACVPLGAIETTEDAAFVELSAEAWLALGKRVQRERMAAERGMSVEALAQRVRSVIVRAARAAHWPEYEPVMDRRRVAAAVVHGIADMISSGTITGIDVGWSTDRPTRLIARCRVRGGGELVDEIDLSPEAVR